MTTRPLSDGLYETLVTEALQEAIEEAEKQNLRIEDEPVDGALLRTLIVRQLRPAIDRALEKADDLAALTRQLATQFESDDAPVSPARLLRAVYRSDKPPAKTTTPLSVSALLTGAAEEPRLGRELELEFASADEVDALVSFVTWQGWRRMRPALEDFARRGGKLRLITTTYTGATDAEAVAAISRLPGVAVRISYDARRTRLHAKAWHFRRRSGFSTAWVGSANLSGAALSGGLEWTMKASAIDLPDVVDKFAGTFETLWNDDEFEMFEAGDEARLRAAIDKERGHGTPVSDLHFFASLKPYPFQQDILDRLDAERQVHGRKRNLVVAATGTGKTLVAAFDYARRIPGSGLRPRLLFVAHRDELLQQSLEVFRHVLRDAAFGERLGNGFVPTRHDHLFTTVQSFASRGLAEQYPADHWDYVVVDECHHSTARTYSELVGRLQPGVLLGLTATPERADGVDLLQYFDGRIAVEIRLWHALERQLLASFDYYGIADGTDLSAIQWGRGKETEKALSNLYTGDDRRAELVIERFRQLRGNVRQARALGFCASIAHAEFMARKFSAAGIASEAVHGQSSEDVRRSVRGRLQRREVNVVFTCDLYNEGVDLPFVDTLLLLRPTSSVTVFLQQLGRGLRLHEGKSSCLVLDFIGQSFREFRFDRLLTALTGIPRGRLAEAANHEFPLLPSGCALRLDAVAREVILENLRQTLKGGPVRLAKELREHAQRRGAGITLAQFLEDTGRPLEDVYEAGGFTAIRVAAELESESFPEEERGLGRRLRLLIHTNDPAQLGTYRAVAAGVPAAPRRLLMFGHQLWHEHDDRFDHHEFVRRFAPFPRLRRELSQLADVLEERVMLAPTTPLPSGWALQLHRAYARREVLAGTGFSTAERRPQNREGVARIGDSDELLFVTLVKEEKRFSPTTRYRDYAISRDLFHWQTQSGTTETGAIGLAYRHGGRRFWLFVQRTSNEPFYFLGPVTYVRHEGSKPMSITWKLAHPMPAALFQEYASLAAA
jgi:superfamily II DNA or RNA helicase/HKD family nuclease